MVGSSLTDGPELEEFAVDSVLTNQTDLPPLARSSLIEEWAFVDMHTTGEANATTENTGLDEIVLLDNVKLPDAVFLLDKTTLSKEVVHLDDTTLSEAGNTTQRPEENIQSRQNGYTNPNMFDQRRQENAAPAYDYEYNDDTTAIGDFTEQNGGQIPGEDYPARNPEPVNLAQLLGKLDIAWDSVQFYFDLLIAK